MMEEEDQSDASSEPLYVHPSTIVEDRDLSGKTEEEASSSSMHEEDSIITAPIVYNPYNTETSQSIEELREVERSLKEAEEDIEKRLDPAKLKEEELLKRKRINATRQVQSINRIYNVKELPTSGIGDALSEAGDDESWFMPSTSTRLIEYNVFSQNPMLNLLVGTLVSPNSSSLTQRDVDGSTDYQRAKRAIAYLKKVWDGNPALTATEKSVSVILVNQKYPTAMVLAAKKTSIKPPLTFGQFLALVKQVSATLPIQTWEIGIVFEAIASIRPDTMHLWKEGLPYLVEAIASLLMRPKSVVVQLWNQWLYLLDNVMNAPRMLSEIMKRFPDAYNTSPTSPNDALHWYHTIGSNIPFMGGLRSLNNHRVSTSVVDVPFFPPIELLRVEPALDWIKAYDVQLHVDSFWTEVQWLTLRNCLRKGLNDSANKQIDAEYKGAILRLVTQINYRSTKPFDTDTHSEVLLQRALYQTIPTQEYEAEAIKYRWPSVKDMTAVPPKNFSTCMRDEFSTAFDIGVLMFYVGNRDDLFWEGDLIPLHQKEEVATTNETEHAFKLTSEERSVATSSETSTTTTPTSSSLSEFHAIYRSVRRSIVCYVLDKSYAWFDFNANYYREIFAHDSTTNSSVAEVCVRDTAELLATKIRIQDEVSSLGVPNATDALTPQDREQRYTVYRAAFQSNAQVFVDFGQAVLSNTQQIISKRVDPRHIYNFDSLIEIEDEGSVATDVDAMFA
jgi:hypothetical protein